MEKHNKKRASLRQYPVLLAFGLFFLGLFVLDLVTPDRAYSELENTTLAQRPKLTAPTADGLNNYFTGYTKYVERSGVWPGRVDQPAGLCGDSPLPEDRERRHPAGQRTPDVPPHLQPALQRDPRPAQEHRRPGIPLPALSGQGQRDAGAGGLRDLPGKRPRGRPAPP